MPSRNADKAKILALFMVASLLSLTGLEVGLRIFTPFPIHGDNANRAAHPVLGYTLDPSGRDIDAAGFRNPTADGPFDIVAIGDSHTQGFNVTSGESWPYQLADRLNIKVYNSGIAGYGIYHYPYLAERAAEKSPSIVLLALYPANDLMPPKRLARDYLSGLRNVDTTHFAQAVKNPHEGPIRSFGEMLKGRFAIASIAAYVGGKVMTTPSMYHQVGAHLIKKGREGNHQDSTDLSDAEVQVGFRNSLNIISNIKEDLGKEKIRFGVVIIPSKGLVIQQWALANDVPLPDEIDTSNEQELIDAFAGYFANSGIDFTDATPFVLAAFQADAKLGRLFYPQGDGHPLANGYRSYADAAAALVHQLAMRPPP